MKTVFFDLDNTLMNHTGATNKAAIKLNKKYFREVPNVNFLQIWTQKTKENWALHEQKKLTFEEQRNKKIIDIWCEFGRVISSKEAEEIIKEYLKFYEQSWEIFPNIATTIKILLEKGITIGVITNGNKSQQLRKLSKIGILKYFPQNLIITPEEAGFAKPSEEIFCYAEEISKSQPKEILFIGDSFKNDIEPAKRRGWNTILMNHFDKNIKGSKGDLAEDEASRLEKEIQRATDDFIVQIDALGRKKEEELMQM